VGQPPGKSKAPPSAKNAEGWGTRPHSALRFQQPPGFAVLFIFVALSGRGVGMETEALASSGGFDGNDVPGILGDHVSDDEINFMFGVNVEASPATVGTDFIDAMVSGAGGLYLDARQVVVPVDDKVEAVAVTIRLGDSEAQTGCLVREGQFCKFSLAFASGAAGSVVGRGSCIGANF
jgi:hypothetical protein